MSNDFNEVTLLGTLGKDPELTKTEGGTAKATFTLATHETFKTNEDKSKEVTTWHNIVTWGSEAVYAHKYFAKGRKAIIKGSINNRSWTNEAGEKRFSSEIRAVRVIPADNKIKNQEENQEGEN